MSLESFSGFDNIGPMNESAFEAFKERMAAAAAQIAAIKKEESKQKQKEEELIKILLQFIKTSQKSELVLLISRALEQNLPANFILAIIVLSNPELQTKEINPLQLANPESSTSLTFFQEDQSLPLKIRIALDIWLKGLLYQGNESPQKLLKTAYELPPEEIKTILIQLTAFVLDDFFTQNQKTEPREKLTDFSNFLIKGILIKVKETLEARPLLGD